VNVRSRRYGPFIAQTPEDDASARAGREHRLRRAREVLWEADCLPDDNELAADLKAVDYGYDASDAILLERKDDMKRRGLALARRRRCAGTHLRLPGRQAPLGRGAAVRGRPQEAAAVDRCSSRHVPLPSCSSPPWGRG
jgi:hypothetical protein